ncbi:GNAT family N-acetyltransferase [Pelomyxa schiedti]|nr:GNAT family N-acetyltransferase [Pelomyxa schiedti]
MRCQSTTTVRDDDGACGGDGGGLAIEECESDVQWEWARTLAAKYQSLLGVDLQYQGFREELENMSHMYGRDNRGCFLLVKTNSSEYIGCVGCRRLDDISAEMKRMFILPEYQRTGIGRILAKAIIAKAKGLGYQKFRLDTLSHMTSAIKLYKTLGFVETGPYHSKYTDNTVFFELNLL